MPQSPNKGVWVPSVAGTATPYGTLDSLIELAKLWGMSIEDVWRLQSQSTPGFNPTKLPDYDDYLKQREASLDRKYDLALNTPTEAEPDPQLALEDVLNAGFGTPNSPLTIGRPLQTPWGFDAGPGAQFLGYWR